MKQLLLFFTLFFLFTSFQEPEFIWDNDKRSWSPLMMEIYKNKTKKFKKLIKKRKGITYQSSGKYSYFLLTPLDVAIRKKNVYAVELLLATHQYKELDEYLMLACEQDNVKIIELLVLNGANPDFKSEDNQTLLMNATSFSTKEVLKHLLQFSFKTINQRRDLNEMTALMLACYIKDVYKVQLLLDYKADKTIKDNYGRTAFDYIEMEYGKRNQNFENEKKQIRDLLESN